MSEISYTSEKQKKRFTKLIKDWFLRERGESVRVKLSRTVGVRKKGGYIYECEPQAESVVVLMCKVTKTDDTLWLAAFDFKLGRAIADFKIVESVLWLKKKRTKQNNIMSGRFSKPCHWKFDTRQAS